MAKPIAVPQVFLFLLLFFTPGLEGQVVEWVSLPGGRIVMGSLPSETPREGDQTQIRRSIKFIRSAMIGNNK